MRFLRSLASLGALAGFAFVAVVLLWSDRAGSLVDFGVQFITRAGRRAEADLGLDLIDRSDIPLAFDQFGHLVLWFAGMLLFGWVTRRFVPLRITALLVAGASVVSEAGQGWASTTRDVDPADAVANLAGVGLGFVALTVVFSLQLAAARVSGRVDSRHIDSTTR